eukprot:1158854-Pelagomonas_calceolata.AAC.4
MQTCLHSRSLPALSRFSSRGSPAAARPSLQQQQQQQPAGPRPTPRDVSAQASGSTYGTLFRVTTFGESHGKGVGCVVDGVPPRLPISQEEIQLELDRRRPGQSLITTPRKEEDTCEPHRHPGPEQGPAFPGLRRDVRGVQALPRRCHVRFQVRHPGSGRGRALLGAGDHWAGGSRGHCQKAAESGGRHGGEGA